MVGNALDCIYWLADQDKQKEFEVKEFKPKRSLNANSYAWALIGELADVLRTDKESVYKTMLKRYGQSEIISVMDGVNLAGYCKYFDVAGHATLKGRAFTHYKIYKGSSEYNTREMSILIDGIVSECKDLDIETLPKYELDRLKEAWTV